MVTKNDFLESVKRGKLISVAAKCGERGRSSYFLEIVE